MTKVKAAVSLYRNGDLVMAVAFEFEERADELGYYSLVKGAARYAEQMGLRLQLQRPKSNLHTAQNLEQEDDTSRKDEGGPEETSGTEVTERGVKPELAWETHLSQERRTGSQTSKAFLEN